MRRLALVSRRVEGLSGAARLIIEEARAAAAADWEVHVFAEKLDKAAIRQAGATPRWVPGWPWGSWMKRRAFAAAAGRMVQGFDLVHGHGDLLAQDILSLHNCVHARSEFVDGAPLPESDAVGRMHSLQLSGQAFRILAANSKLMKDDVVRRFGVPEERVAVVHPGFDSCRFNAGVRENFRGPMRAELGVKDGEFLAGLVTSGDFEKRGVKDFLKAVAKGPRNLRALIVGKEARPGPYLTLAAELGIADRVLFRDPIPEVWKFYHALDVYVHAARWEEFGMSVLEALACGVPVISGEKVGAAEILSGEARSGVMPEPSPDALAAALNRFADNAELRARLAALGPELAAPRSWDAHGRRVLALYGKLLPKSA